MVEKMLAWNFFFCRKSSNFVSNKKSFEIFYVQNVKRERCGDLQIQTHTHMHTHVQTHTHTHTHTHTCTQAHTHIYIRIWCLQK